MSGSTFVRRLLGYIQDTSHVLSQMENIQWANQYVWVTLDVVALYSSIPHHLAIAAIQHQVNKYSSYSPELQSYLLICIEILLTHYFFFFLMVFIFMGAKCLPSLANLFMGWWEECFIFSHNNQFFVNFF